MFSIDLSAPFPFADQVRFFGLGCLMGWATYAVFGLVRFFDKAQTLSFWVRPMVVIPALSVVVGVVEVTLIMFERGPFVTVPNILVVILPAVILAGTLIRLDG